MVDSLRVIFAVVLALTAAACAKKEPPATSVDDAHVDQPASAMPTAANTATEPGADTPEEPEEKKADGPRKPDVIYVPTPQPVVDKMLELAKVKKSDVVYDLGCGDGRIVVTAAKKYGVKAVGFDIDPKRVKEAQENVKKNGVEDLVTIEQKDIFTLDLSPANVVTLYLLPS